MNFAKAYESSVRPLSEEAQDAKQKELLLGDNDKKDPARLALIHSWMQSTVTQEMIADINANEAALLTLAIQLAVNFPVSNNAQLIIQTLIRVDTLRKLKETYAHS